MVEKNEDRSCYTCKYEDIPGFVEPCNSCCYVDGEFTNYIPKKRIKYYPRTERIKRVIFNGPATIVFWNDGTKTVVKCREGDTFDPEKGLAMAIAKKALGNENGYYEDIKKWMPKAFEKTCDNCKYTDLSFISEPCHTCILDIMTTGRNTKWEPEENSVEKSCETCKYHNPTGHFRYGLACALCNEQEYWEPKE